MSTLKITARLMVNEPRCVDAVKRSDACRSTFSMLSHSASASPRAGRSNCAFLTTARCQNITAPAATITALKPSGIVIPCHSAKS